MTQRYFAALTRFDPTISGSEPVEDGSALRISGDSAAAFAELCLLEHILPELEGGVGVAQNQAHSYDVFEHNLRSLQHAADKGWPLIVRIAALLHDVGKAIGGTDHSQRGAEMARGILARHGDRG